MSGESIYAILPLCRETEYNSKERKREKIKKTSKHIVPPSVSTFGIHGTSTTVANVSGVDNAPSIHPAKKAAATFGRSVGDMIEPSNYMKKNEGVLTASRGGAVTKDNNFNISEHHTEKNKAAIPSRNEKPVLGMKTRKNYVVANAVENIMAIPAKSICENIERPTQRADYGVVPAYLEEMKKEITERREYIANALRSHEEANERWAKLSQEELLKLRNALHERWEKVNKMYQSKSFNKQPTPSQQVMQENLEKELRNLEFAMLKLSRTNIYIYDDQKNNERPEWRRENTLLQRI